MNSASGSPGIPAEVYPARLESARDALRGVPGGSPGDDRTTGSRFAALLISPGADLQWLTGYDAIALERLTLLVLPADGQPTLLVPRLEVPAARRAPAVVSGAVPVVAWEETDSPFERVPGLIAGRRSAGSPRGVLVSDRMPAAFVLRLQSALPGARFGLASKVIRELRMVKDANEIELLRTAARAADRVVEAIGAGRLVGRSEVDVAAEVRARLVDEGHDRAAFWIVGSGPNSASPHHAASDRLIEVGSSLVLDIGGVIAGYGSDITRTFWVSGGTTPPPDEYRNIYAAVEAAQAAAVAAVRPGTTCEDVDAVARRIISDAGFGDQFVHRTGHGIGLEEHEDPYIVAGNREPLRPGFAFSVEPGIYLADRYGVRIEDIVVCGRAGPDVLNAAPRGLAAVPGV